MPPPLDQAKVFPQFLCEKEIIAASLWEFDFCWVELRCLSANHHSTFSPILQLPYVFRDLIYFSNAAIVKNGCESKEMKEYLDSEGYKWPNRESEQNKMVFRKTSSIIKNISETNSPKQSNGKVCRLLHVLHHRGSLSSSLQRQNSDHRVEKNSTFRHEFDSQMAPKLEF